MANKRYGSRAASTSQSLKKVLILYVFSIILGIMGATQTFCTNSTTTCTYSYSGDPSCTTVCHYSMWTMEGIILTVACILVFCAGGFLANKASAENVFEKLQNSIILFFSIIASLVAYDHIHSGLNEPDATFIPALYLGIVYMVVIWAMFGLYMKNQK